LDIYTALKGGLVAKKNFFLLFFIFFSKNRVFSAKVRYNYIYRYLIKKTSRPRGGYYTGLLLKRTLGAATSTTIVTATRVALTRGNFILPR
jgi:hypothetical protein